MSGEALRSHVELMLLALAEAPAHGYAVIDALRQPSNGHLDVPKGTLSPSAFHALGVFLLQQFFLTLPRELEESAVMDGAGRLRGVFEFDWIAVQHGRRPQPRQVRFERGDDAHARRAPGG